MGVGRTKYNGGDHGSRPMQSGWSAQWTRTEQSTSRMAKVGTAETAVIVKGGAKRPTGQQRVEAISWQGRQGWPGSPVGRSRPSNCTAAKGGQPARRLVIGQPFSEADEGTAADGVQGSWRQGWPASRAGGGISLLNCSWF